MNARPAVGVKGADGYGEWEVWWKKKARREAGHGLNCPHYDRIWTLRSWPLASLRMCGVSLMRLRDVCTAMWCCSLLSCRLPSSMPCIPFFIYMYVFLICYSLSACFTFEDMQDCDLKWSFPLTSQAHTIMKILVVFSLFIWAHEMFYTFKL